MPKRLYRLLLAGLGLFFPIAPLSRAAQLPPQPSLPLPHSARLVWVARATGVQIYKAQGPAGSPGALRWVFQEPEATLEDPAGNKIGRHFRGPCWEAADGSRIEGAGPPLAQVPGRTAADVPWLVVPVKSTGPAGVLSAVTRALRIDTLGGAAPATPPTRAGEIARVPYRAIYLFLAPEPGSSPAPH
ncbi:conserved exported protein of unknown function [Methylacidimicrobium sp. AP8]|uniref:DUF3455 domain-containing protein n=1 Tax=Methylacidimicrobium sp. AP8 TaxID=2730359 RepID=UPI0018C0FB9F|nr:DUF3455 domain-containing protein [Methylacidimicrobium sp. AP8]CAB4243225.1 conserved exported protein of unknown function [Methylacidimicrobium sp. AP8]